MTEPVRMGIAEIRRRLPHRFPFLLVDEVLELEPGRRGKGIKNVTYGEQVFQGHFPEEPIMPGVLIIECVAQMAGIVLPTLESDAPGSEPSPAYLMKVDRFKFTRRVVPGDRLVIDVTVTRRLGKMAKVSGEVLLGDAIAASGELTLGAPS